MSTLFVCVFYTHIIKYAGLLVRTKIDSVTYFMSLLVMSFYLRYPSNFTFGVSFVGILQNLCQWLHLITTRRV